MCPMASRAMLDRLLVPCCTRSALAAPRLHLCLRLLLLVRPGRQAIAPRLARMRRCLGVPGLRAWVEHPLKGADHDVTALPGCCICGIGLGVLRVAGFLGWRRGR